MEHWQNLADVFAKALNDADAFREFAAQIARRPCVRSSIRRILRRPQDQQDALQEVLMQAYRSTMNGGAPTRGKMLGSIDLLPAT